MEIANDLYIKCSTIRSAEKKSVLNSLHQLSNDNIIHYKMKKITQSNLYSYKASMNYRIIIKKDIEDKYTVIDILDKKNETKYLKS